MEEGLSHKSDLPFSPLAFFFQVGFVYVLFLFFFPPPCWREGGERAGLGVLNLFTRVLYLVPAVVPT